MVTRVTGDRTEATPARVPLSETWVSQGRQVLGNRNLSEAQVYEQVTAWQTLFKTHGYYQGAIDGQWGKSTQDALDKLAQQVLKRHGYYSGEVDGAWGDKSKAAMAAYLRAEVGTAPKLPTRTAQQFYVLAKEPAFRSAAQQAADELLGTEPIKEQPLDPRIADLLEPESREPAVPSTRSGTALPEPGSGTGRPTLPPAGARAAAFRPAGNPRDASFFKTADQWETQMNRWEKVTLAHELGRLGVSRELFGSYAKTGTVPVDVPPKLDIEPGVWSTMVRPLLAKLAADYRQGIAEPRPEDMDTAALLFEIRHQARYIGSDTPSAYTDGARGDRLHELAHAALQPMLQRDGSPSLRSVDDHQKALVLADAYCVLGELALTRVHLLRLEENPPADKIKEAEAAASRFQRIAHGLVSVADTFENSGGLVGASGISFASEHTQAIADLGRRLSAP